MTRAPEPPSRHSPDYRTFAILATLGLLLLAAAFAGASTPLRAGPTSSGLAPAGAFTCPSAPANHSAVTLTANVTSGPAPLSVAFCSASAEAVLSTHWNFGNNVTSTSDNTTYTFTQVGGYDVTLNVTFAAGGYSTASVSILATAGPAPFGVSESATPVSGPGPLSVTATTTVTSPVGSVSYSWGATQTNGSFEITTNVSSENSTTFELSAPGAWYIEGMATDTGGDSGHAWTEVTVENGSSNNTGNSTGTGNATFQVYGSASPTQATAPATINFDSYVIGGPGPFTFSWYFGDGGNGSGENLSHVYTLPGNYSAEVAAHGTNGTVAYDAVPVAITGNYSEGNGSNPILNFTATPDQGASPLNLTFYFTATGGTRPYNLSAVVESGMCIDTLDNWSGALVSFQCTLLHPGNYTATAVLTDAVGATSVDTLPIIVTVGSPLSVTMLESPAYGPAPLAVGFLATVTGGTAPYGIQWSWGDGTVGSSGNGAVVAHAFTTEGTYTPTLTVTDTAGQTVTVILGPVNVTAGVSSAVHSTGLLPSGGTPAVVLAYLGIAIVGALVSGLAVGYYLRQRGRQREGAQLVAQLETTANRTADPTNRTEGER